MMCTKALSVLSVDGIPQNRGCISKNGFSTALTVAHGWTERGTVMRLIDADAIKAEIQNICDNCWHPYRLGGCPEHCGINDAVKAIDTATTVDAVQVVRCKDCKWRDNQKGATEWMPCRVLITPNNFYCASGKRKDCGDGSTD